MVAVLRFKKLMVALFALAALGLVSEHAYAIDPAGDEQRFIQLINAERAAHGLGQLSYDQMATNSARAQANRMADVLGLFHNPDLASDFPSGTWAALGENVGRGSGVEELHAAFMNSPSHRANVLGDFNLIGVGVVYVGSILFVAEVFVKTRPVDSTVAESSAPVVSVKKCNKYGKKCRVVKKKVKKSKKAKKAKRSGSKRRRR